MDSYYKKIRKFIGHDLLVLPAVAARILDSDNNILLVKKRNSQIWGFPAGIVELNETAEEAIKREMLEELNARVEIENYEEFIHRLPLNTLILMMIKYTHLSFFSIVFFLIKI